MPHQAPLCAPIPKENTLDLPQTFSTRHVESKLRTEEERKVEEQNRKERAEKKEKKQRKLETLSLLFQIVDHPWTGP